jgi:ribosomal protein S27AE
MASLASAIDVDAEEPAQVSPDESPRIVAGTGKSDAPLELASSDSEDDDTRAKRRRTDGVEAARGGGTCAICLCDVEAAEGVRLRACGHEVHRECAKRLVDASDRDGCLCPESGCRTPLALVDIRAIAGPRAADRAARLSLDKAVDAVPDLYRCPAPDCGFVVSWTPADGPPRLDCGRCGLVSCLCCGKPWHQGPCDTRGDMDEASRQYLRDAGVRRCERCGAGVVKASGCDKMKCRCGYQFCYQLCGNQPVNSVIMPRRQRLDGVGRPKFDSTQATSAGRKTRRAAARRRIIFSTIT